MPKRLFVFVTLSLFLVVYSATTSHAVECGDINSDDIPGDISDLVYLVDYMFVGGPAPPVMSVADIDGDPGSVDIVDLVYLVDYMFVGGPPPDCPIYTAPSTTTIIPEEDTTVIIGYDTTGVLVLDESSTYAQDVVVGDVIIGQDDTYALGGFLRKVTSKTTMGDSVVIETEQATMMEAFETMNIDEVHQLSPSDVRSYKLHEGVTYSPSKDEVFNVGLYVVLFDLDGNHNTTNDQIRLDGDFGFTAELFAELHMHWFTIEKLEVGIETSQDANVELTAVMQWEFDQGVQFELARFVFTPIPLGGIVWLVPTLTVEAHVHGDLTVTFVTGVSFTQELRIGLGYANGEFYGINESTRDFVFTPPQFTAEFNFEPGVSLNVKCLIYGLAGPYAGGKAGFHFQSVLSADPCNVDLTFDLEAILYAVAGVECPIIGLDYSMQWELYSHLIGEWVFPLGGSGTIYTNPEPDYISAPWFLVGPCSYSTSGNGDETLTELYLGDYTMTWGTVAGWIQPSTELQTLSADEAITFNGIYIEETDPGTIVIDPSPNNLNANWTLTGPNGYYNNDNGDQTLSDMEPGSYTIVWSPISGWITPSDDTQTLSEGGTISFQGVYVEESVTGTVIVNPTPDHINAPWSLSGPGGYNASGNGDETISDLDAGSYSINWGGVSGWETPSNSSQSLPEGGTITFNGVYVEIGDSTGTVTDIDGNVYQTVKIGDQWWMAENLKVTHYRNGNVIPHNYTDGYVWGALSTGAYCEYNNDPSNVPTYGLLYNWFALDDSRGLAPSGWHVPSYSEWEVMISFLGGASVAGGKLKEAGTAHWNSPNSGATNESGFTALPGGYRYEWYGMYSGLRVDASFWSSTGTSEVRAYDYWIETYSAFIALQNSGKVFGSSVRCVKD